MIRYRSIGLLYTSLYTFSSFFALFFNIVHIHCFEVIFMLQTPSHIYFYSYLDFHVEWRRCVYQLGAKSKVCFSDSNLAFYILNEHSKCLKHCPRVPTHVPRCPSSIRSHRRTDGRIDGQTVSQTSLSACKYHYESKLFPQRLGWCASWICFCLSRQWRYYTTYSWYWLAG